MSGAAHAPEGATAASDSNAANAAPVKRSLAISSFVKRLGLWALSLVVIVGFYGAGKVVSVGPPRELPMTAIDDAIPFLPWTVWLYSTITWASLAVWLSVPDRVRAARLLGAIVLSCAACAAVFVAFPTTFPRSAFPLGELLPGAGWLTSASHAELTELRASDSPTNCLPSLHVALAVTLAAAASRWLRAAPSWARHLWPLPALWAVVVAVTTLTTKQHYAIDVPAGALVGVAATWAAARLFPAERTVPAWMRPPALRPRRAEHRARLAKLRRSVEAGQWSLDAVAWPEGPLPPLDPTLVRLINELIYVEEIAGMNFRILEEASADDDLRTLYRLFAEEERRHADGLRRVLALHEAPIRPPGLGNSLVLDEFDALDARSDGDAFLVATANPVFETMLDAGTVPFLRTHPALASPWFEDFVERITRDEAAHLAVNWTVIREAGESHGGLEGLRLLINPSIYRGMIAVPFMSIDVYSLAHRMGYRFETLLPAFGKLWRLHRRYPELARFPLWWVFRLFVVFGVAITLVAAGLQRSGVLFIRFWTTFTRFTDALARSVFGRRLLEKRRLPAATG